MEIDNPFGKQYGSLVLPDHTNVIKMRVLPRISEPDKAIRKALAHPIDAQPLAVLARRKREERNREGKTATAVIVISDNTRPVPYTGKEGILLPVIEVLLESGYRTEDILVLIATGTHHAMLDSEIEQMIDAKVLAMGVKVVSHDCKDDSMLVYLGNTRRKTEIFINKQYMEADLKIATGLVESHFMAGVSGGRKAICPGLLGEKGTYVFHGASFMADPNTRDLNLEHNVVHEEAVQVASKAGIDFLVNVTLDQQFHVTGIFAGDFLSAHEAAVKHITASVRVEAVPADVVVTHAGFVGINHYQCAKCAVASLGILRKNGYLVIIADTTDSVNVVGSINYRTTLALLVLVGPEKFLQIITSKDWTFIPEQWQVQMWAKVFERIPMDHVIFYAPQMDDIWWDGLPGINGSRFLSDRRDAGCYRDVVEASLQYIAKREDKRVEDLAITYISDGPYVIPQASL